MPTARPLELSRARRLTPEPLNHWQKFSRKDAAPTPKNWWVIDPWYVRGALSAEALCAIIDDEVGPSADAVDAVIEQLQATFAPIELWHLQCAHQERREATKAYTRARRRHRAGVYGSAGDDEDIVIDAPDEPPRAPRAAAANRGARQAQGRRKSNHPTWPEPLHGAASDERRWSTPRPQDRRPRDGKRRAPRHVDPGRRADDDAAEV